MPTAASRRDRRTRADRARAFTAADPTYQRVRPGYPPPIVAAVLAAARDSAAAGAPARIADVGAGTGKLTELLAAARDVEVHAVEPAAAMAGQLRERLPHVRVHAATAEDTGLATATIDAAVFAQSWHWVDERRAAREADRVLRPAGALVLVWNQLDVSVPWVHRLTRIMRSGDVHSMTAAPDLRPAFGVPDRTLAAFEQRLRPADVLALARSRSSYLRAAAPVRARMQQNLTWYLAEHLGYGDDDAIALPYRAVAWVYRRRAATLSAPLSPARKAPR